MQYPDSPNQTPDEAASHSSTNEPAELCSAAFDGEVTAERAVNSAEQQQLHANWTQLRSLLQELPQQPVDLVASVREARKSVAAKPSRSDSRQQPRWVALTTCLAALVVVAILPWLTGRNPVNEVVTTALVDVMTHYGDPDSWNVVVIDVADTQTAERTVQRVLGTAAQRGAGVARLGSPGTTETEFSAGMLVSAGTDTQSVLESLSAEAMEADWNPSAVGQHSSQEIKQMFVEAMRVPTRSDLVFGAMYVVDETGRHVTLARLPAADQPATTAVAVAAKTEVQTGPAESVDDVTAAPTCATRPLIVIFRKVQTPEPDIDDSGQGHLPDAVTRPASV